MLTKIGHVEVWRLLDLHGPFMDPNQLFPNAPADVAEIIEDLAAGSICAQTGLLILPVQGFLLKTPKRTILVDSCVGNHKTVPAYPDWHQRDDSRFMASLTAAGLAPADVDVLLCTHLHTDHVGWNTKLEDGRWVPTFPNARYVLPHADEAHHRQSETDLYQESVLPVIANGQAEMIEAPAQLSDEVHLILTPGHTPGHVSVLIDDGDARALITGDALHSSAQCSHPDWHFKFDAAPEEAVATRRELLEKSAEERRLVIGSHFALPSLGHVDRKEDAFRFLPL
ncbi:MAG: MBL fold metallo-hydrolase [Rhodobacteraceae bacterium]|nr:MBL fold metallo-hydrolase [Paracoccaceae bacterium]